MQDRELESGFFDYFMPTQVQLLSTKFQDYLRQMKEGKKVILECNYDGESEVPPDLKKIRCQKQIMSTDDLT